MEEQMMYRPRELFEKQLKEAYHKTAEEYFEQLSKTSKVNPEENAAHVKQYNLDSADAKAKEGKASSARGLNIFLTVAMIASIFIGMLMILFGVLMDAPWWVYLIAGILVAGGIASFIVKFRVMKGMVARREKEAAEAKKKAEESLRICYMDMAPLNARFDWNAPAIIMEKATPLIDLDPIFTPERFCYLRDKFGLQEVDDPHQTVLGVISGQIQGNPFIVERILTEQTGPKTYTGSITIHWTTTYHDKNGTHVEHHSQTLVASISRPAPFYRTDTRLIYGNEAAPHLTFSRSPSGVSNLSEKEKNKLAAEGVKRIKKLSEKQLKEGSEHVITPMGNDRFDAFFGADDRNNEVEFRLLFTPLAQKNMLDLIENPAPYGDDFVMVKEGMVNSVASAHSQGFDYSANPERFAGYDYEAMKSGFVSYCDSYIQSLFFDLAPLLSIPLYQMHKPHEYIYGGGYGSNLTAYEHESMANSMDPSLLRPEEAGDDLPLILKQISSKPCGKTDEVLLSAYSFKETPKVEYVTKMGGDGRAHEVPVHWIQYDLVQKETSIGVRSVGGTRYEYLKNKLGDDSWFKNCGGSYQRGLFAFLLGKDGLSLEKDAEIASLFTEEKTGNNSDANS